jgi:integrase/recombinase XerD
MVMQNLLTIETTINEINLIDSFLYDCAVRNFSPWTIASYKGHLNYFFKFYSVSVNINDLKDFLILLRDERGLSASTVENYFCSLSTFFEFLEWEKVIEKNLIPQFRKQYIRY